MPTVVELLGLLASGAAGAALARLLRLPMWPMTGAIAGSAVFHVAAGGQTVLPRWWTLAAQVAVGIAVGSRLGPTVLRDFRAVLLPGALAVVAIIAAGVGLGLALFAIGPVGLVESVFGMVPGGVGEMVAAVDAMDGDSALVAAMHLARLLIVLSILPVIGRWLRRRAAPDGDDPDERS